MVQPSKIRSEVGVCPPCTQGPVSSAPGLTLGTQQTLLDGEVERAELPVLFSWNISCIHGHYLWESELYTTGGATLFASCLMALRVV